MQVFKNNLSEIEKPVIEKVSKAIKDYTKISFIPDFEKFGMKKLIQYLTKCMKKTKENKLSKIKRKINRF